MEQNDLRNIKNIIFDLGVVLLDLDFVKANEKFKLLGIKEFEKFYSSFHANHFFHDFETGKIDETVFIAGLMELFKGKANKHDLVDAWNTIIVGFPEDKVDFLLKAAGKYKIYMLSNTNSLHAKKYETDFFNKSGKSIHDVFKKIYYSHDIGIRKPDVRAYTLILKENKLMPRETVFIDDIQQNLEPAKELTIKTIHYKKEMSLFTIFNLTK